MAVARQQYNDMIRLVSQNGSLDAQDAIKQGLSDLLRNALASSQTARAIRDSLRSTVRAHFEAIYPGSKHWDPKKVVDGKTSVGSQLTTGSVDIDVPGVARAYHDVVVRPRIRKHLAIPIHRSSYGKSAKDFSDLLLVKSESGSSFLAKKMANGALAWLFVLKDKVFQRKDPRLMPTDGALAQSIFQRVTRLLDDGKAI